MIKEIKQRLGDQNVSLNGFVISNNPAHEMALLWSVEKADMENDTFFFRMRALIPTSQTFLIGL